MSSNGETAWWKHVENGWRRGRGIYGDTGGKTTIDVAMVAVIDVGKEILEVKQRWRR